MNAILTEYSMNFFQQIKNFIGFLPLKKDVVTYFDKKVLIYKVPKTKRKIDLKLKKILKKDGIEQLYLKDFNNEGLSQSLMNFFHIINEKFLISEVIDEIILKVIKSIGKSKEKITLGIYVNDGNYDVIKSLEPLKEYLKCLYIYGKITSKTEYIRETFFLNTGIPVILKEIIKDGQSEILVFKNDFLDKIPKDVSKVIDLTNSLVGANIIKNVKLDIPSELKKLDISHLALAKLFDEKFEIRGLLT